MSPGYLEDKRTSQSPLRIEPIDYLRGLFAISVLIYHFAVWDGLIGSGTSGATLQKLGLYAVCGFYVISGISFGYVYRDMRIDYESLRAFWIKRYFRLAPLFILAVAASFVYTVFAGVGTLPGWRTITLNVTLLFGIVRPGAYIPTGGWSIGNEMAFYLIFPFVLVVARRGAGWAALVLAMSVAIAAVFAFWVLTPSRPLAEQWESYINPLNHLFLFVSGVVIAMLIGRVTLTPDATILGCAVAAVTFVLLPLGSDGGSIVTGWERFGYSFLVIALGGFMALGQLEITELARLPLHMLGQASYSVYLLHPIIYRATAAALEGVDLALLPSFVALPISLGAAYVIYNNFEKPMVRVGKRIADRPTKRTVLARDGAAMA